MTRHDTDESLICFLITSLSYGGAQTVLIEMAKRLQSRGWSVKVVSMIEPAAHLDTFRSLGMEIVSLDMQRGLPDPRAILKLRTLLRAWRPQVLHCHMVHANLLGRIVRLFTSIPVVVSTAHSIDEGGRWREIAYRLTDRLADVTTNISQAAVERYIRVGAAPRERIRYIPNGLDTEKFHPDAQRRQQARDELEIGDDFVWLAVGRIEVEKDFPTMLRAFARCHRKYNAKLLIAGEGPLRESLEDLAHQLGIEQQVRFLGVRKDVPCLMNAADGYLMSSVIEGLPMVLLEAGASAVPIVTTDVGGNREALIDGVTGFLVSPEDPPLLANAVARMMELPKAEREKMGACGREHVESNYSLERIMDMWEALYREFSPATKHTK